MQQSILHSPYVNPLTIVQRKDKPVRICVDPRQVNKEMVPDRAKTPPAHEPLQRFHGAKYISSIDLNRAFLQIGRNSNSKKPHRLNLTFWKVKSHWLAASSQ